MYYVLVVALGLTWFILKTRYLSKKPVELGIEDKLIDLKEKPAKFTTVIFGIFVLSTGMHFNDINQTPEQKEHEKAVVDNQAIIRANEAKEDAVRDSARNEENSLRFSVKERITKSLKDPDSINFGHVFIGNEGSVCGRFNAKNSFGAYVGFKRFVGGNSTIFVEGDHDSSIPFPKLWQKFCSE